MEKKTLHVWKQKFSERRAQNKNSNVAKEYGSGSTKIALKFQEIMIVSPVLF